MDPSSVTDLQQQSRQQGSHGSNQTLMASSSAVSLAANPTWQTFSTSNGTAAFGAPRQTPQQQFAHTTPTYSPPPSQHPPAHSAHTPSTQFHHFASDAHSRPPPPHPIHVYAQAISRTSEQQPPTSHYSFAPVPAGALPTPPPPAGGNDPFPNTTTAGTSMQFVQLPTGGYAIMVPVNMHGGGAGYVPGLQPTPFYPGAPGAQPMSFAPAGSATGQPMYLQPVNAVFAPSTTAGVIPLQAHADQEMDDDSGNDPLSSTHASASSGATGFRQLIVNFLDPLVTNAELHAFFSQIGPIDSARIIIDKDTGKSKGFGFVYYKSSADAGRAVAALNGQHIQGRPIKVSYANHRKRRN